MNPRNIKTDIPVNVPKTKDPYKKTGINAQRFVIEYHMRKPIRKTLKINKLEISKLMCVSYTLGIWNQDICPLALYKNLFFN